MSIQSTPSQGLSREQLDTIDRFEADFNAIDHYLRSEVGATRTQSFTAVVKDYSRRHRGWRDAPLLDGIAELRNALVHGKTEPSGYLAVPSPSLMDALARCRETLTQPFRAIPAFQRTVEVVGPDESLTSVLKRIATRDYSQFPVYDAGRFIGLITENGITRWLALCASKADSLIELDDVKVRDIASAEEKRANCAFASRMERADDVCAMFANSELLEAILITHSGKESESPLGIATRWDVSRFAPRPS